jgi:hypothetical protein
MGTLFELKEKAYKIIEEKKLDKIQFGGKIGLKAGFMLPFVVASTSDDKVKIDMLRKAISEVLDVNV